MPWQICPKPSVCDNVALQIITLPPFPPFLYFMLHCTRVQLHKIFDRTVDLNDTRVTEIDSFKVIIEFIVFYIHIFFILCFIRFYNCSEAQLVKILTRNRDMPIRLSEMFAFSCCQVVMLVLFCPKTAWNNSM